MQRKMQKSSNGCLGLIFSLLDLVFGKLKSELPYRTKDSILTRAEHNFYATLSIALEDKVAIIPKVGLQDIFLITDQQNYRSARNRISTRHIDFLICEPKTLKPLFGIELDDKSHNKPEAQKRDEFKNTVFEAATLPLVRFAAKGNYRAEEIKEKLEPFLKQERTTENVPNCPKCGIPMIRKTARQGEFKGRDFWACPNYPTCKEIVNIT